MSPCIIRPQHQGKSFGVSARLPFVVFHRVTSCPVVAFGGLQMAELQKQPRRTRSITKDCHEGMEITRVSRGGSTRPCNGPGAPWGHLACTERLVGIRACWRLRRSPAIYPENVTRSPPGRGRVPQSGSGTTGSPSRGRIAVRQSCRPAWGLRRRVLYSLKISLKAA